MRILEPLEHPEHPNHGRVSWGNDWFTGEIIEVLEHLTDHRVNIWERYKVFSYSRMTIETLHIADPIEEYTRKIQINEDN